MLQLCQRLTAENTYTEVQTVKTSAIRSLSNRPEYMQCVVFWTAENMSLHGFPLPDAVWN